MNPLRAVTCLKAPVLSLSPHIQKCRIEFNPLIDSNRSLGYQYYWMRGGSNTFLLLQSLRGAFSLGTFSALDSAGKTWPHYDLGSSNSPGGFSNWKPPLGDGWGADWLFSLSEKKNPFPGGWVLFLVCCKYCGDRRLIFSSRAPCNQYCLWEFRILKEINRYPREYLGCSVCTRKLSTWNSAGYNQYPSRQRLGITGNLRSPVSTVLMYFFSSHFCYLVVRINTSI